MWRTALIVAAKEIRTAFRDRQTVIYTVVLPLVMYPAMFWVMIQAATLIEGKRADATVSIAIEAAPEAGERLEAVLRRLELSASVGVPGLDGPDPVGGVTAGADVGGDRVDSEQRGGLVRVARASDLPTGRDGLRSALEPEAPERADVALWVPAAPAPLEILFDGARARSDNGRERLAGELRRAASVAREEALAERGRTLESLEPVVLRQVNLSSSSELGAFVVSLMLPMMIVLMAVMGAFYPAVDLTAGERERKTEETTLLIPAPRLGVQLGKLMAVSTASAVATAVNLLGMGFAAGYLLSMLGGGRIGFELAWADVLLVVPVAIPLVIFVSAVLTAVASLAETFKQGQSLLGAAQMLFIFPAVASSLPGLELTPGIASLPVVGAAIAFRTILRGGPLAELPWGGLAIAILALLVYAAIAVAITVRLLDQELSTGGETSALARLKAALRRS